MRAGRSEQRRERSEIRLAGFANAPSARSGAAAAQPGPGSTTSPPKPAAKTPGKSALEFALEAAFRGNPDLRVALAKLNEAEAELARVRLQVAQKVVTAFRAVERAEAGVAFAKDVWQDVREKTTAQSPAIRQAEQRLTDAKAKLADLANFKVESALTWYAVNLGRGPTVKEVADAVHVSTSHLRRLFWQVRRTSPKTAFQRIRLDKAQELMSRTAFTLEGVARHCGYASASHFCREYRAVHHFTPGSKTGFPEGQGGIVGIGTADFLQSHFNTVGTRLVLVTTLLIGLLLAADDLVLRTPGMVSYAYTTVKAHAPKLAVPSLAISIPKLPSLPWFNKEQAPKPAPAKPAKGKPAADNSGKASASVAAQAVQAVVTAPEDERLRRQFVQTRRLNLRMAHKPVIAPAVIVRNNQDDVRRRGLRKGSRRHQRDQRPSQDQLPLVHHSLPFRRYWNFSGLEQKTNFNTKGQRVKGSRFGKKGRPSLLFNIFDPLTLCVEAVSSM